MCMYMAFHTIPQDSTQQLIDSPLSHYPQTSGGSGGRPPASTQKKWSWLSFNNFCSKINIEVSHLASHMTTG